MSKEYSSFSQKRGYPLPLGATILPDGINFAVFSRHAQHVILVFDIFDENSNMSERHEISLLAEYNKTGDIWHVLLPLYWKNIRYGYIIDGVSDKEKTGTVFERSDILIDPYCRMLASRSWGEQTVFGREPCCQIPGHSFDWKEDTPLKIPLSETIIYEMHVRGFTQSPTSGVDYPGTYLGIIEKIPYLKSLGITAVELMPIAEFDENDNVFRNPDTGELLRNFWGYNSINFFSLKSGYAADPNNHINEFKEMVLALHRAGIEVILDIVFNHSGEGGYDGTTTSFRGIDNPIYYLLDPKTREYMNFSGCGNTLNCNHPVVRELIRKALRYWVIEMHVDGFRFDLASILGRDKQGNVLPDPPMLEIIAEDPILRDTKIIAEAWDAAGLYQVGSFSTDSRWSEWNGKFRDDVRSFFAGFPNSVTKLATRIAGSSDLYQNNSRGPGNSINLITSHDGFTLMDLVSFEKKNNRLNGENNRDGDNHNLSWNSGYEGYPAPKEVEELRLRRAKSMAVILLFSQGVPMITAGDEFCRSQDGNNNAWCQDNQTSWIDWSQLENNQGLFNFFKYCIGLRKTYKVFRQERFFAQPQEEHLTNKTSIHWQYLTPGSQNWSDDCHGLAFHLRSEEPEPTDFFIMVNNDQQPLLFTPPALLDKRKWHTIIDTSKETPRDFSEFAHAPVIPEGSIIKNMPFSCIVLQGD